MGCYLAVLLAGPDDACWNAADAVSCAMKLVVDGLPEAVYIGVGERYASLLRGKTACNASVPSFWFQDRRIVLGAMHWRAV